MSKRDTLTPEQISNRPAVGTRKPEDILIKDMRLLCEEADKLAAYMGLMWRQTQAGDHGELLGRVGAWLNEHREYNDETRRLLLKFVVEGE